MISRLVGWPAVALRCGGLFHRKQTAGIFRAGGCIDFGGCDSPGTRSGESNVNRPLQEKGVPKYLPLTERSRHIPQVCNRLGA